ncbi:protein spire isoform X2 [Toxorhynchites rutilus septentrionalis]|uniref:protein spire isoform X2 n=1 Tax=Toxorhynchites rutilus septentrionalis TaxID=329112 RepID=UPI0024796A72|nr:protein spire isoform X2 [Toxorhynchites rutilus septentrionalis]
MADNSNRVIPSCPPLPKDLTKKPPTPASLKHNSDSPGRPTERGSTMLVRPKGADALGDSGANALSVSLEDILKTFNAPISEDQAWALIYQSTRMFKAKLQEPGCRWRDLQMPVKTRHLNVHKDGYCFVTVEDEDKSICVASSQKKILLKLGIVVYTALDYNLPSNEDCPMSHELEELIEYMTAEDNDDEGIEHDSEEPITDEDEAVVADHTDEDDEDDDRRLHHTIKYNGDGGGGGGGTHHGNGPNATNVHSDSSKKKSHLDTKELDHVLAFCSSRVSPSKPEDHYRAVCRALATETLELRTFLQRVCQGDAEVLRLKAQAETSGKVLEKIHFTDWSDDHRIWQAIQARFWMQVVDELRRGVRLKKINFSRTPIEYELTPYEILMEDIRSRKYNLRKVMVDGDIPPKVKKDAHAVILEFIRSRPPLRKASERKLAPQPLKRVACPREQLLDSIRKGRVLKPVHPKLKTRLLPTTQVDSVKKSCDEIVNSGSSSSSYINSHSTTNASAAAANLAATAQPPGGSGATPSATKSSLSASMYANSPRNTLRLIPVDFSLFEDDDFIISTTANSDSTGSGAASGSASGYSRANGTANGYGRYATLASGSKRSSGSAANSSDRSNLVNNENNQNNINTVLRRTKNIITHDEYHRFCDKALETYDLATQCESRRASMRRHTIIGCNQNYKLDHLGSHSVPPSRPTSRQSDHSQSQTQAPQHQQQQQQHQQSTQPATNGSSNRVAGELVSSSNISSLDTWTKNSLDEHQWRDTFNLNDRLSLTLEEIVHIRSVMTKAELEGLPVDVHIKEDVEKRKVCFLCLRTRFTIFARGILCKLCQRTVCNKCNQKMRIPTEHFRNVPVVLLSPSLMNSPCTSNTPSPSHHAHGGGSNLHSMVDESFPRSLMERLLRPELDRKTRNTVGSAPSSPKNQRSASSTPGTSLQGEPLSLPLSQMAVATNGAKEYTTANSNHLGTNINSQKSSVMSRSMEGPHSLPPQSPARPHSNNSTLDRSTSRNRFAKAFTLSAAAAAQNNSVDPQKERLTGELMAVCNDCRSLVLEIIRSSRQTRSSAQNQALRNLTLDLSPVYKR